MGWGEILLGGVMGWGKVRWGGVKRGGTRWGEVG